MADYPAVEPSTLSFAEQRWKIGTASQGQVIMYMQVCTSGETGVAGAARLLQERRNEQE